MKNSRVLWISFILSLVITGCGRCGSGTSETLPEEPDRDVPYYAGDTYPAQIDQTETSVTGNVFYVDPSSGSIDNSGSETEPWNTFQAVIENNKVESTETAVHPYTEGSGFVIKNSGAPVKGGDTIILKSGHHGNIFIQSYFNTGYINVIAEPGATVSRLYIQSGCRWRFRGLTVRPDSGYTESYALVFLETHSWRGPVYNITIDDFTIYSVLSGSDNRPSGWSQTDPSDWNSLSCNGITAFGDNITIRRNNLANVNFGITLSGNYGLVSGNTIENFAGDGMRGLGNDLFFEDNTVKNLYVVNENHPDGFQSWSIDDDPPRERVVLRRNTFINYTDPEQPFQGYLQGIGCFDGWYVNWIVENNVVITNMWHGITLTGAVNCRILNNTVIDLNDERPGPPWIAVIDHKNGLPSSTCIIRNNISPSVISEGGVTSDHNFIIENFTDYASIFQDHVNYNLRLRAGAAPIDTGSDEYAPSSDKDGNARPYGTAIDPGAYEYYP